MVAAARKYNRVVQGGTQRRSSPRFRRAISILHSGVIGEIYMARWLFTGPRDSSALKMPKRLRPACTGTCGSARRAGQPFHRNLVHYNWHWFWEFGNGEMGNNGVHSMDIVRWALKKGLPARVHASGGRFGYKDQGQTPNTQIATFQYEDGVQVLCEIRGLYSNEPTGMHFYGSAGSMHLEPWGACKIFLEETKRLNPICLTSKRPRKQAIS